MTTIHSMHGLHGKLLPLRDWDFPDDPDAFWNTVGIRVAHCFGRKIMRVLNKRVHAQHASRTVYEIEVGIGRAGTGNIFASFFVTEASKSLT